MSGLMMESEMSVQAALRFIHQVRRDERLWQAVSALGKTGAAMEDLVAVAAAAGFEFTAEDLRDAHRIDWGMRWARAR
jgi:predicted ribosomally synthesized peptide with nif11-like leader